MKEKLPTTETECKKQLKKAQEEIRRLVKESRTLREEEQLTRLAELELSQEVNAKKKAAIIRKIKKTEAIAAVFAKLRKLRHCARSGLSQIQVPLHTGENPKTCTEWRTLTVPHEVETALLERNRKHFGQAKGTPFTVAPLSEMVDFTACTHTADLILEGNFQDETLDTTTQLFVSHLK